MMIRSVVVSMSSSFGVWDHKLSSERFFLGFLGADPKEEYKDKVAEVDLG